MSGLNDELAHIELLIDERKEFDEAMKPENQKIFPFYVSTNFKVKNEFGATLPRLWCSYCRDWDDEGNGFRTMWDIVFESPGVIKTRCSPFCHKAPRNLMRYRDQLHGFRQPITLPNKFKGSIEHQMVYDLIIHTHDRPYWLRTFYPKGINREIYNKNIQENMHGGTYKDGWFVYNSDGLSIYKNYEHKTNRKKAIELLKPSLIILRINEIITEFTNTLLPPDIAEEFIPPPDGTPTARGKIKNGNTGNECNGFAFAPASDGSTKIKRHLKPEADTGFPLSNWANNRNNFVGDPGPLAKKLREHLKERKEVLLPDVFEHVIEYRAVFRACIDYGTLPELLAEYPFITMKFYKSFLVVERSFVFEQNGARVSINRDGSIVINEKKVTTFIKPQKVLRIINAILVMQENLVGSIEHLNPHSRGFKSEIIKLLKAAYQKKKQLSENQKALEAKEIMRKNRKRIRDIKKNNPDLEGMILPANFKMPQIDNGESAHKENEPTIIPNSHTNYNKNYSENDAKIITNVKSIWRDTMQITHIKIAKDVDISYTEAAKGEKGGVNTYKVSSQEKPVEEFRQALQSLAEYIPKIIPIPKEAVNELYVMGVTFIYKKDISGFTITSKLPVPVSNSPAIYNTPNVYERKDGGHDRLPDILFEKLEILKKHAIDYINGERAELDQHAMNFGD